MCDDCDYTAWHILSRRVTTYKLLYLCHVYSRETVLSGADMNTSQTYLTLP